MCKELKEELDRGQQAAADLAQHLIDMGAAQSTIPVKLDGKEFEVQIRHLPQREDDK